MAGAKAVEAAFKLQELESRVRPRLRNAGAGVGGRDGAGAVLSRGYRGGRWCSLARHQRLGPGAACRCPYSSSSSVDHRRPRSAYSTRRRRRLADQHVLREDMDKRHRAPGPKPLDGRQTGHHRPHDTPTPTQAPPSRPPTRLPLPQPGVEHDFQALAVERRCDRLLRPPFDAVLRDPIARLTTAADQSTAHQRIRGHWARKKPLPNEEEFVDSIIDTFRRQMQGLWKPRGCERGGNTKNGIVRAEFMCPPNLPKIPAGRVRQTANIRAWLRFSGTRPYIPRTSTMWIS